MERLNLRTPKKYVSVSSQTRNPGLRFFLVTEGQTEESYFEGIKNNRINYGIRNEIKIEIVPKAEGQEGLSHPYQLVVAALECMGRIDAEGNEIPKDGWEKNCKWDFDAEHDRVCVIFDRDYRGLEKHLKWIFDKCKKNGIFIAMSNPNFELWLLMHFPEIERYDKDKLLQNPKNIHYQLDDKASKDKKYLEILVSNVSGGYTKGRNIKFERFGKGVLLAVEQEKLFEEDIEFLPYRLGSNLGVLFNEMRSN